MNAITAIKAVYAYPISGSPKTYPAVVFFPDTVENVYSTTGDNFKTYRFKMWIIVDLSNTTESNVFENVLPNTVDKVIQEFDGSWSHQIDNHRAWLIIDSGLWGLIEDVKSRRAFAELTLTYRVSNDI